MFEINAMKCEMKFFCFLFIRKKIFNLEIDISDRLIFEKNIDIHYEWSLSF